MVELLSETIVPTQNSAPSWNLIQPDESTAVESLCDIFIYSENLSTVHSNKDSVFKSTYDYNTTNSIVESNSIDQSNNSKPDSLCNGLTQQVNIELKESEYNCDFQNSLSKPQVT